MTPADEIPLPGGEVNHVVRVGNTVRRSSGPWGPTVLRVLAHLRSVGFSYAPEPLGMDEQGRESVTFLEGDPAWRPWPSVLHSDDGVHQAAVMVGELSAALASYEVRPDDDWRHGGVPGAASTTLRHGDLGLWNTLWQGDRLTALVDWDYLEPAPPLWDFAQLCWYIVPTRAGHWQAHGFAAEPDYLHRMGIVADHAGTTVEVLARTLLQVMALDRDRTLTWGGAGRYPWDKFLAEGFVTDIDHDAAFVRDLFRTAS